MGVNVNAPQHADTAGPGTVGVGIGADNGSHSINKNNTGAVKMEPTAPSLGGVGVGGGALGGDAAFAAPAHTATAGMPACVCLCLSVCLSLSLSEWGLGPTMAATVSTTTIPVL